MDESLPIGAASTSALDYALQPALATRREAGLWRSPKTIEAYRGSDVLIDGRWITAFASNDYLGFAQDRAAVAAPPRI
jgi:7-keto-8-aminopelargonate synthetase-like enzyme